MDDSNTKTNTVSHIIINAKPPRARPDYHGVCQNCGAPFVSKKPGKKFCTHKCFIASPLHAEQCEKRRAYVDRCCRQCGKTEKILPNIARQRKGFCSRACYRKYFAERFDRFVASPESIALPQNFDEFLSQPKLSCPFDGCEWKGKFLGLHVNVAHGVRIADFKRLAGFNKSTGLCTSDISGRHSNTALRTNLGSLGNRWKPGESHPQLNYVPTLEAREHMLKAQADPALCEKKRRALQGKVYDRRSGLRQTPEMTEKRRLSNIRAMAITEQAVCAHCGQPFQKRAILSRHRYCSQQCSITHRRKNPRRLCSVEVCQQAAEAKGLCRIHYARSYRAKLKKSRATSD